MKQVVRSLSELSGRIRDWWRFGQRAPFGRVFVPDATLDSFRTYVSDALTFTKLKGLLRAVDGGDVATVLALFEEMEEKDLHLQGVANTRRAALTGLDWEVVSATEVDEPWAEEKLADEAAQFVNESLRQLDELDEALEHMTTAIGPNVAVLEQVWDRNRLVDLVPIPSHRLRMATNEPGVIRVITKENQLGVPAAAPKFVVHMPHSRAGLPFRCTICQAHSAIYLIKLLAIADWAHFAELFGMPVRWATFQGAATPDEKAEMLDMLKNMGTAGYGLFSEAVQLNLLESSQRREAPFKDLIDWCERKQSIGWLGQHMTTDTSGSTGTFAAANVQDQVRHDLLEDDVKREGRTIRRQIIAPMVAFKFPGKDVPLPVWRRRFREQVDRKLEAEIIGAAQRAGMKVGTDWAHERISIPKPDAKDEVLEALDAFEAGVTEGTDSGYP